jgi:5'-deoxynucleotidase YfbR-like HD superfamily hydrolase
MQQLKLPNVSEDVTKVWESTESFDLSSPLLTDDLSNVLNAFYNQNPNFITDLDSIKRSREDTQHLVNDGPDDSWRYFTNHPWIKTFTGRKFNPTHPYANAIVIEDIAHSLAMQCRFNGHSSVFMSVAQHSVMTSYICNFEDALHGLLHDASEAYLSDIPRPLKNSNEMESYRKLESNLQKMIFERFGLNNEEPESVRKADNIMLSTEAHMFMKGPHQCYEIEKPLLFKFEPLNPNEAELLFMKRFNQLCGK